jgi:hypothetical protein
LQNLSLAAAAEIGDLDFHSAASSILDDSVRQMRLALAFAFAFLSVPWHLASEIPAGLFRE